MGPDSDARVARAVDQFMEGSDGKPGSDQRKAGFDQLSRVLVEEGRLVDLAFVDEVMRDLPVQFGGAAVDMLRNAFFLGAKNVLKLMEVPDGQTEVTDADITRIENMRAEIDAFAEDLARREAISKAMAIPTAGSA